MSPETYLEAPADQVRAFLAEKGMSQSDFARELEVHRSTVSNILNGHDHPSLPMAAKIERLTGVSASSWAEVAARRTA